MAKKTPEVMQFLRKDPDKYWKVKLFEERGYERKQCPSCGKYFWSMDGRERCGDPPCGEYEFLGNPPGKKSFDLIKMWKEVEKFFVDEEHTSVNRYPVICRWFPGLYFTVASIVNFQRSVGGKPVFEFPVDPLVVPQPCLRFNDIPNIGVSGRHMSCFTMIGQHSKKYWKDECMRLDYDFMTRVLGIPEEKIMFLEDIWAGPSAFGSSLEYFVDGLELGTSVFTSFWGTPEKYTEMDEKVIDMGAGLERFTWISQGTPTIYDASYGDVIQKLKKQVDYDESLFLKYSKLSGRIDADTRSLNKSVEEVASQLGISNDELDQKIRPVQALYAISDHAKALAFAISDSGLPSNVGGGYNLRVILRRALDLIKENDFSFELMDVCDAHASYLKPVYPSLAEHLDQVHEILDVEEKKYEKTLHRARRTARTILAKTNKVPSEKMLELYESQGVTPELIKQVAKKEGKNIEVPSDFYSLLTESHSTEQTTDFVQVDAPPTEHLYYSNPEKKEFDAKVLKNINYEDKNWVILDKTLFYGEKGGQDHDTGWLEGERVKDVQEMGQVTLHQVDKALEGKVHGKLDWERRRVLRNHHSCTHVVNGACRRVLGDHVWQAGAWKDAEKAHLDITHYENLSEEQVDEVEALVNKVIKESRPVTQELMQRVKAEKKYGFRLYQGGAVPAKELFIVNIKDWDVEACGGTHISNTRELGKCVITGTDRIQDGIVRINFKAGSIADKYLEQVSQMTEETAKMLGVEKQDLPEAVKELRKEWKKNKKSLEKLMKEKAKEKTSDMAPLEVKGMKVYAETVPGASMNQLREVSKRISTPDAFVFLVSDEGALFVYAGEQLVTKGVNAGQIAREIASSRKGGAGGPPSKGEGKINDVSGLEELVNEVKEKLKEELE